MCEPNLFTSVILLVALTMFMRSPGRLTMDEYGRWIVVPR